MWKRLIRIPFETGLLLSVSTLLFFRSVDALEPVEVVGYAVVLLCCAVGICRRSVAAGPRRRRRAATD